MSHYNMNHAITKKTFVLTFKSASLFTNELQRSLVVHPLVSALPLQLLHIYTLYIST